MSVTYMTRQQQAVLACIAHCPEGCATAAELTEQLHAQGQAVGLTTVYRQLERLAQQGRVGSGSRVLLVGFGGGLTWGAALVEFK